MNTDRNIKLLLLKLGKQGHDASLIKEQRYSQQFGSVYSRYRISFWLKVLKKNKRTGEMHESRVPNTFKFDNAIDLLKFMVVKANERKTESVR